MTMSKSWRHGRAGTRVAASKPMAEPRTSKPLPRSPGQTIPAPTPGPLARATGITFRALSQLRGARIFHPHGIGYDATLQITSGWEGVPALAPGAEHRALVRLSRAAGLPRPLPDALGIGLRLPDVYGEGRH